MKIVYEQPPMMQNFTMFAGKELYNKVKEQQKVIVDIVDRGKTAVNIGFYLPGSAVSVNVKLENENYSFKTVKSYSYFDYKEHTSDYFKLSKKQEFNQLLEHIANLINYYLKDYITDFENFQIIIWKTPIISKLLNS